LNNSYKLLDTTTEVRDYSADLNARGIKEIALDIEGEFNLHRYGEHLCLVQIFDGRNAVVIDPLWIDIQSLREVLENPQIQKIMFDCASDRTLLFRQHGIQPEGIVDLAPAVELLEYPKRGLDQVLHIALGKDLKPKKKFQRYNWMRRPLEDEALAYAVNDVMYLFELKAALMGELESRHLLEDYFSKNEEVRSRPIPAQGVPGVFKKNRFRKLPARSRALFKELFEKRESYARDLDVPPNSVVSNEDLFRLASEHMKAGDIRFRRGIPEDLAREIQGDFEKISGPREF
jgi:ribonuclease D